MTVSADVIEVDGPWRHRRVAANGARFHVAEAGDGPLVLLLHGFPQFWWAWRHQLPALAAAGYRAVAMDLRGFGGSDKPPRGYDPRTVSADVAGVVKSLGESSAVVVGQGWGGFIAWTTAVLQREVVAGLGVLGMAHPRRMRAAMRDPQQLRAARHLLSFQLPVRPERTLLRDGGAAVEAMLRAWAAPGSGFPDPDAASRYRDALSVWPAPHCALEYHRWFVRSLPRRDGRRFAAAMARPVTAPVLHLHGAQDPTVLLRTVEGSQAYVRAPYRLVVIEGAGHFLAEEQPAAVTEHLLTLVRQVDDEGRSG
jgi:pimeloyl-ACP methyl ester carboxylesterase